MENQLKVVAENDQQLVTEENNKNQEVVNSIEMNIKVEYEPNFELEHVDIKEEPSSPLPLIKSEFEEMDTIKESDEYSNDETKNETDCGYAKDEFAIVKVERDHPTDHLITDMANGASCARCNKTYTRKGNLTRHKCPLKCDICNKLFPSNSKLSIHRNTHTLETLFTCAVCNKSFSDKRTLIKHNRTHTGYRPFQCNVCNKLFPEKTCLEIHMRVHTGERPFVCDICNKSFSQKSNLAKHRHIHDNVRPFKCDVCDKAFIQRNQLISHNRVHPGIDSYSCDSCKSTFTHPAYLKKHVCKK